MAGIIAHIYLADKIFKKQGKTLFPKLSNMERSNLKPYFVAGALTPDIGQFPFSDSFISSLSHYTRTKKLSENIINLAENNKERAFAYGWISHVYVDKITHPYINKTVANRIFDFNPDDYDLMKFNPSLVHMRLEFGYDLDILGKTPGLLNTKLEFPEVSNLTQNSLIQRAYLITYGYEITDKILYKSQKSISKWTSRLLKYYTFVNYIDQNFIFSRILTFFIRLVFFIPLYLVVYAIRSPTILAILMPKAHTQTEFFDFQSLLDKVQNVFYQDFHQKFKNIKDWNLDTGKIIIYGSHKHADATLRRWMGFLGSGFHRKSPIKRQYIKRHYKEMASYLRSVFRNPFVIKKKKIK